MEHVKRRDAWVPSRPQPDSLDRDVVSSTGLIYTVWKQRQTQRVHWRWVLWFAKCAMKMAIVLCRMFRGGGGSALRHADQCLAMEMGAVDVLEINMSLAPPLVTSHVARTDGP